MIKLINFIDNFLNRTTMYKLVLYVLMVLITVAIILALFGVIPYKAIDIIYNNVILYVTCYVTNWIFGKLFKVARNLESFSITAMILTLIITPGADWQFLVAVGAISQTAKYLLAYRGKHIFNPAAIALVITLIWQGLGASWWVGNMYLLPFVVIGGLLIVRKIQHFDLVISFMLVYFASLRFEQMGTVLLETAIIYFAFIMLTEPSTSPPTRILRIAYGALVGILFGLSWNIGPFYSSPELALVFGNIFSFLVSNKARYKMKLLEKKEIAPQTYRFVFEPNQKLTQKPGQYLEWTVGHKKPDLRGNRRYFTVASSPTENHVDLGIKFYDQPSTFKKALMALSPGDQVLAGQLAGDFTLPKDPSKKLAFIAGGIGITPFRSMIKYLIDQGEKRDIALFYAANTEKDFAYRDILEKSPAKIIYKTDRLTAAEIKKELPDYLDRVFYISGPHSMVDAFEETLKEMDIPGRQIKIDFFPGYV